MNTDLKFSLQPQKGMSRLSKHRAAAQFKSLGVEAYTEVVISKCTVSDDVAAAAVPGLKALAKKKSLRRLEISNCLGSVNSEEVLRALSQICDAIGSWKGIESVEISDNEMDSKRVAACKSILEQPLKELNISNNMLDAPSLKLIGVSLCRGQETALTKFYCKQNPVQTEGLHELIRIMQISPYLEDIRFTWMKAEIDAMHKLCTALESVAYLKVLDLSGNDFDLNAASALGVALKEQRNLEILLLEHIQMSDNEARAILEPVIESKCPLNTLDLSRNKLSSHTCTLLISVIQNFANTLSTLALSGNDLGDASAVNIADALSAEKHASFKKLTLASNNVKDLGAATLVEKVSFLPNFTHLDLSRNPVSPHIVHQLKRVLGNSLLATNMHTPDEHEDLDTDSEQVVQLAEMMIRVKQLPARQNSNSDSPTASSSRITALSPRNDNGASSSMSTPEPMTPSTIVESSVATGSFSVADESQFETPTRKLSSSTQRATGGGSSSSRDISTVETDIRAATSSQEPPVQSQVFDSAKKLVRETERLNEDVTAVMSGLNEQRVTPFLQRLSAADTETEANVVENADVFEEVVEKSSGISVVCDLLGALLAAVFIVVLVMSVVKSQEETSFAYRPI